MNKYKVTAFIWENDKKKKVRVRKYITLKDGLTWQDAKALRKVFRGSQIVKMM